MAGSNICRAIISGNLTRDPHLVERGETKLVELRVAVNTRVKRSGEWVDKANYFNVTVFGAQSGPIKEYLSKGSGVMVDGRLDWREYDKDDQHFEAIQIIADNVQFLDGRKRDGSTETTSTEPAAASAGAGDDDIPF